MPLATPRKNEEQSTFISRCMSDGGMLSEFPNQKIRAGVCHTQWREKDKMSKLRFARIEEMGDGTFVVEGVEIFRVGRWKGKEWGEEQLSQMEDNFNRLSEEVAPGVKLGHVDVVEGGVAAPRFGTVSRIYKLGKILIADFSHVPRTVAELIRKGAYPRVSVEMWHRFKSASGEVFQHVIDAVALLGSEVPEITTLKDIVSLYDKEPELVLYDKENREVEAFEYESENYLEKYGILKDALEAESRSRFIHEVLSRAADLSSRILMGHDEFEEESPEGRAALVNGVMQDIRDVMNDPKIREKFQDEAGEKEPSQNETEPEDNTMSDVDHKEELSRVETERDEFSKKAEEEADARKEADEKLTKWKKESAQKTATIEANAYFDGLEKRMIPAERDIIEPLMVAALAGQAVDAPITFAKKDETIDVVDAIKSLFELRKDMPEGLFDQVLKTDDTTKGGKSAVNLIDEKAAAYSKEESVTYAEAYKFVRSEDPDLAKRADEEFVVSEKK